ncbi:MAG: Stp1/IreP family PP2C-type Ser/Thr phosphatase [Lachnospiraceae bacterium]|nr:Stp1/IreP family PP2C-type Ser/Thr phosphatase [Lachnospiraceae bacterium]
MRSYSRTDVGTKRDMNQDYLYCTESPIGSFRNLFIVADGMGGHAAGDEASKRCVEGMVSYIANTDKTTPVSIFNDAISYANQEVYNASIENPSYTGMGTTVVAATIMDNILYVANIGDSRLYLIRDDIKQITNDHSLVEEMVKRGDLTVSQARVHPQKNIITRALGIDNVVHADYFEVSLAKGDRILLCSDGLTNMVDDYDLQYFVKHSSSPEEAVNNLVDRANESGGLDNITVILVENS